MNEKYGIELQAIVNKFKATMQSTANFVKNLGRQMEEDVTFTPNFLISDDLTKKELEKFKKELEVEMKTIQGYFDDEEKMKKRWTYTERGEFGKELLKQNIQQMREFYDYSPEKLKEYEYALGEINNRLEANNDKAEESDNRLSNAFKKGIASIKKFSFYLLGVRTTFSLLMKYQNIYFQNNEQLQYQTELSQNAIALSLGPAFQVLGDVISYVSIGFARFIELLFNTNILSKVTTRGIRNYNKSLKETQTLLSGIDEITNLTTPQTTGLLGQYQALEDFRKKVAEVEKFFQENKWIKDLAKGLREVWEWIGKNLDKLPLLVAQVGTLFGLITLIGATPLTALVLSTATLVINTVSLIKNIKEYMRLKDIIDNNEKTSAELNIDNMKKILDILKNYPKESEEYKIALGNIKTIWDNILLGIKNGEDGYIDQKDTILEIANELKKITGQDYVADVKIAFQEHEENTSFWKRFKTNFKGTLNSLLKPFKGIFDNLNITGGYANGLDYVPYDNYPALLHKGEAVVPAKYNPAIHSAGNDYTNALLETLVTKMDDLASRPNVFEIDGQKFANATYSLYTNQEKRQNYNTSVVVR